MDLVDFIIFSEMQIECKELSPEVVEECIQFIKINAPKLNPMKAEDREKIQYGLAKYF
ncbi:unnamed protein product, partial [marine sediment metagenome]